MMTKNESRVVSLAFVLGMWFLGSPSGQCFCNPAGRGDGLSVANAGDSKAALRATGPMARANHFRLSTNCQADKSDLVYYGYRYYNASTGRWLSRDQLGEQNAKSVDADLYEFVRNNAVNSIDVLGQWLLLQGNLSDDQSAKITRFQESILNRLPSVRHQLQEERNKTDTLCCINVMYRDLLARIITYLKGVEDRAIVSDFLALGNSALDPTHYAETTVYSRSMAFQNRQGKTFFWGLPQDEQEKTFFHELSHIEGTLDGPPDLVNDADFTASVYLSGLNDHLRKQLATMALRYCSSRSKPKGLPFFVGF